MPRVQFLETAGEPLALLRQFDALDRGRGWIADGVGGLDRLQAPAGGARAQPVDRPVAGNRHHPGDRARPAGVECGGFAPHREIDVLQHVLGLASILQDTQADAEKLRRRVLVNHTQCGAVAAGNARESGGKLAARGVCIHSV